MLAKVGVGDEGLLFRCAHPIRMNMPQKQQNRVCSVWYKYIQYDIAWQYHTQFHLLHSLGNTQLHSSYLWTSAFRHLSR